MATNFGFPPVTAGEFYFVSYNTQDSARVGEIAREMNGRGIPLWYDEGLLVGEKWERQIAHKIRDCKAVILFVTKKLMAKETPYVKIEYDMAMGYKKKIYVIFLDNITFDDVTIDLKGWWLRLNELHGVPVSGKFFANDIVDIMDRHIHFIKNTSDPEPIHVLDFEEDFEKIRPSKKEDAISVNRPIETDLDELEIPVHVVDFEEEKEPVLKSVIEQEDTQIHIVDCRNKDEYVSKYEKYQHSPVAFQAKTKTARETTLIDYRKENSLAFFNNNSSSLEKSGKIIFTVFLLLMAALLLFLPIRFFNVLIFPFYYDISPNEFIIITGVKDETATELKIPNKLNELPIRRISSNAFSNCASLQSVTIPDGVLYIDDNAFNGCPSTLTIYGKSGSRAETYAKEHNINFVTQ